MAFGPDGRLYATQLLGPIVSYAYNAATGVLTDKQSVGITGFGIAFGTHSVPGTAIQSYLYVANSPNFEGIITRLGDTNANARWGEPGEVNVDIVRGVPIGDHTLDHMQIHGTQLYIGIGARTTNGRNGQFTGQNFHDEPNGPVGGGFGGGGNGFTYGETSYNGAIGTIRDLSAVPNLASAAQLRDGLNGTTGNLLAGRDTFLPGSPHAQLPYTSTAVDRLVVHSAGTRNPFGLATDASGALWFTNNYGRADTNGDGTSQPRPQDALDSDLSDDVHDQLFRAVQGSDYGYDNTNFRGTNSFPTQPVRSTTFDNLDASHPNFGLLHDPANPDGLGPSSSSNGLDFGTIDLTGLMATDAREYAVIARWNGTIAELPPGGDSVTFRDVVVVDPESGQTRRIAEGFDNPIDVESDGNGGFLVADWGFPGTVWRISPRATTSRWNRSGAGTWSDPGSWIGPVPNGTGAVASFTGAATEPTTVLLDSPKVFGTLSFDNPQPYRLIGQALITIDVAAGFGVINGLAGNHRIDAPVHLAKNTTVTVLSAATLMLTGHQSASANVTLTKDGGGALMMQNYRVSKLNLNGGTAQVIVGGGNPGTSYIEQLSIAGGMGAWAATFDIADSMLVIAYVKLNSPIDTLVDQIKTGYAGGAWTGTGIVSSCSTAPLDPTGRTGVGYAEATDLGLAGGLFGGVVVDADSILVRFTLLGDSNLDGSITLNDFTRLAAGFGFASSWSSGDFNYDGFTNLADFTTLAANFGQTTQADFPRSALPEPSTALWGLLALVLRLRKGAH